MTQTLSPIDQFLHDYNTHVAPLTLAQKFHLLAVLAIQMEWDQDNPCDEYSLSNALADHPFEDTSSAFHRAVALLEGRTPKDLASWMLELVASIETELPAALPPDVDRFSQEYNAHASDLRIPEQCHLLAVLAIGMQWNQEHPHDRYTLVQADDDHPFIELATRPAIALLQGKPPQELATWMLELAPAIEDELPA